ncbi:DUF4232 domain-containing protein [Arthrobacter sp. NEB 688]|uniref:DUF4232 domain-containing protein n=1 Tax=Arthrobacter sp. NEB 688 TaxID=904039 RepID=UPI001566D6F7|nr:DUF4232 domain-containing protein [Arthrobacter sp. NEB 688]QKE83163.1 DUF4232 domain-containing protein [Arthrobacter sp. NEB 688]
MTPWGRVATTVGAVVALSTAGGCAALGTDPVDGVALDSLTHGLDRALAGLEVRDARAVEALVRDARPTVVDPERTDSGVGQVEYATYGAARHSADAPVAVVVWHRTVGGGPFVDDGGVWHVVCARLSLDRSRAAFAAEPVGCPGGVEDEPSPPVDDAAAPHLDLEARDDADLVVGTPPRRGSPAAVLRATAPGEADPCAAEDLDLALGPPQRLTGVDAVPLRVVNTGVLPCRLAPVTGLSLTGDDPEVPVRPPAADGTVVLAPRASTRALLTWRPSEAVDRGVVQRVSLTGPAGDLPLVVRHGSPGGPVVMTPAPGAGVTVSRWQRPGYGVEAGDDPVRPDLATSCGPDELAVTSERAEPFSGSPAPPSVEVRTTGVTPCLLVPSVVALPAGVPDAVDGPPVLLAPGESTPVTTVAAGPDRPGQVLVADRWVAVGRTS